MGCLNGQPAVVSGDPNEGSGNFAYNGSGDPAQYIAVTNPDRSPRFTRPTAGTFNTQRVRNSIYNPGFQNWNVALFKRFAINERTGFQFRAEAFNFINHPNWNNIASFDPTSANFGKVTGKNSERNLQLSLRYYF